MNNSTNPTGWPQTHAIFPYAPGKHQPRTIFGVTCYPYDVTKTRINSWVCIKDGQYLGIIAKYRNQTSFQVQKQEGGMSDFAHTMHDAVRRISK